MTLKEALARAREALTRNNIEDASLESELLLRHTLQIDRVQLYLGLDVELTPEQETAFRQLIERRRKGEPTAYITGHREFYGLDFYVNRAVLIPRPETELLVEKALGLAKSRPLATIADIGTGCGAIAVTLAKHLPNVRVYATDVSADALKVARTNCERHGVAGRVVLLQGNLLEPLPEPVDLLIANLPYVREADIPQNGPISYEPRLALYGGKEGLDKIKQLVNQLTKAGSKLRPEGCLLLEIGQGQAQAVTDLLNNLFPTARVDVTTDLAGIERVVSLRLTAS